MPRPISSFWRLRLLGNFAFDGQGTGVAEVLEGAKEVLHADVAFAQRHFGAPLLAGPRRPLGVLAVDAADVAADLAQGLDRLAGAVEDHVGRIEVDEQVVAVHVAEESQQRVGRLLAGLQVQILPVGPAVVAQLAGMTATTSPYSGSAASCGTKPTCSPTASTPSSRAKSEISFISCSRAARVAGGTRPTVRATVGMSA